MSYAEWILRFPCEEMEEEEEDCQDIQTVLNNSGEFGPQYLNEV